jgi:MFS family permease
MTRAKAFGVAAALVLVPTALFGVLAAAGQWSWASCLYEQAQPLAPFLLSALGALHPLVLIGQLPFAALAAIWFYRQPRHRVLLVWLALAAAMLWMLLPPASLHDCDRKGTDVFVMPWVMLLLGWPAVVLSLFLSRPAESPP